ncbi:hypothetical protein V6N13_076618 [Hibiscus sabdariffa]
MCEITKKVANKKGRVLGENTRGAGDVPAEDEELSGNENSDGFGSSNIGRWSNDVNALRDPAGKREEGKKRKPTLPEMVV